MITAPNSQPVISLDMLNNYHRFFAEIPSVETLHSTSRQNGVSPQALASESQPSDEAILGIRDLDRQMNTENYLPIFHLRQS